MRINLFASLFVLQLNRVTLNAKWFIVMRRSRSLWLLLNAMNVVWKGVKGIIFKRVNKMKMAYRSNWCLGNRHFAFSLSMKPFAMITAEQYSLSSTGHGFKFIIIFLNLCDTLTLLKQYEFTSFEAINNFDEKRLQWKPSFE